MSGAGSPHSHCVLFVSVGCGCSGLAAAQRKEWFAALACRSAREEHQDCCLGTGLLQNPRSWVFVFSQPCSDEGSDRYQVALLDLALSHLNAGSCLSNSGELWPFSGGGAHPWMLGFALCCQLPIKNFPCFLVHVSLLCLDPSERERASFLLPVTACSQECLFSIS